MSLLEADGCRNLLGSTAAALEMTSIDSRTIGIHNRNRYETILQNPLDIYFEVYKNNDLELHFPVFLLKSTNLFSAKHHFL